MITRIKIKNFKRFGSADVELGDRVVLVGPNNSGKTTCLQALALWHFGMTEWVSKKSGKGIKKRTGVTINRKELVPIPIPETDLLWKDRHVRKSKMEGDEQKNENIKITIEVDGIGRNGKTWNCGLEFDYGGKEQFYCRPLTSLENQELLKELSEIKIAFLPPMSGLSNIEPKLEMGRINVLMGEGQTAQVLRNLCYYLFKNQAFLWEQLRIQIKKLFGITLESPNYLAARGEIMMNYKDQNGKSFDLISSGRGFQQTLLILAYLYVNPKSILLVDEPDAHLEFLRQRQIYQVITEIAGTQESQVIAASHSEIILNEAADRDIVIAFVGKPHRIDDRGSQLLKSLKDIGFDQSYQAEQTGWVLYLEGSTDLAIIREFAKKLNHPVLDLLDRPFVHYVENKPNKAQTHFYGLREAKKDLVGVGIYDRLENPPESTKELVQVCWKRREIENYFISKESLISYATSGLGNDLFTAGEIEKRGVVMNKAIDKITEALKTLNKPDPWSLDIKVTDDFLDNLFESYFKELKLPNLLRKTDYHTLVKFYNDPLDKEIQEKLDQILSISKAAKPE